MLKKPAPILQFKNFLTQLIFFQKGMTLIELLVVVGILIVIAGGAFPIWSLYSRNQDIKLEAEKVSDDFKLARNKAINNEQGEYAGDDAYSVVGYYVFINNAPVLADPPNQTNGLTSYQLKMVKKDNSTDELSVEVVKSVDLLYDLKIYQGAKELTDSVYFSLPFGKSGFYTGEPHDSSPRTASLSCLQNSEDCAEFYVKKDGVSDYYYKISVLKEGTIISERQP